MNEIPRPEKFGRVAIVGLQPPRRRQPPAPPSGPPKTPLFFYDRRGGATLNWRHWGAYLIMLINIITLPLAILVYTVGAICLCADRLIKLIKLIKHRRVNGQAES